MSESSEERHLRLVQSLRVAGVVLTAIALVLVVTGLIGFVGSMGSDLGPDDFPPTGFWVFAAGLPFLAVGGFCLRAGFFGAALGFLARESSPAIRRVADDVRAAPGGRGRFCGSCGAQRDAADRFCPGCGTPVAAG